MSQIEPHFLGRPAYGLVTALTAPSQLRHYASLCNKRTFITHVYTYYVVTIIAATMGGIRVYKTFSRENVNY